MSIPIRCRGCGHEFRVRDSFAGRQGRCPKCSAIVKAPAPAPAPVAVDDSGPSGSIPPIAVDSSGVEKIKVPTFPKPEAIAATSDMEESGLQIDVGGTTSVAQRARSNRGRNTSRSQNQPMLLIVGGAIGLLLIGILGTLAVVQLMKQADSSNNNGVTTSDVASSPNQPSEEPSPSPPPEIDVFDVSEPIRAATQEEIRGAMVKIKYPVGRNGGVVGTGFIINSEGWVATNHHVIEKARDNVMAEFVDGVTVEIAGIIAELPERDLAIVKLKALPGRITILDINRLGETPNPGDEFFAYGFPGGNPLSLSKGICSSVVTTSQLVGMARAFLDYEMHAPSDQLWIQHDAAISPGNSGGPLFDKDWRVVGVNTWVNEGAHMGYASHIMYLRNLAEAASGEVRPFGGS